MRKNAGLFFLTLFAFVGLGVSACNSQSETPTIELNVSVTELTIEEGKTATINYTISPIGTEVTFTSADSEIATVTANGVVNAVKEGNTTVTVAVSSDTSIKKDVAVTVTKKQQKTPEEELEEVKETAVEQADAFDLSLYRDEEKQALSAAIETFKAEVAAAQTQAEVAAALDKLLGVKNNLKTKAEYEAEEAAAVALATAKTNAKAEIDAYVNQNDYDTAAWDRIQTAITAAKASIDAASTPTEVATILANVKSVIDAIDKKGAVPNEQALLEALSKIVNFTIDTKYVYDGMNVDSINKFTSERYTSVMTASGHHVYTYPDFITEMSAANIDAAKATAAIQYEYMRTMGYDITITYDDVNQTATLDLSYEQPTTEYLAYDKTDAQFYVVDLTKDNKVEHFSYLLNTEVSEFSKSFFGLNEQFFFKLVNTANYDAAEDVYRLSGYEAFFMVLGNNKGKMIANNISLKFENGLPKEFKFTAEGYGGKNIDYVSTFSNFGNTVVDVPQFEKPVCTHAYCAIEHEDLGEDGHTSYCDGCHKYVAQPEAHAYDATYHFCKKCHHVENAVAYTNDKILDADGNPYVNFVQGKDNKIFAIDDFSSVMDIRGSSYYMEGVTPVIHLFAYEKSTHKLAVIKQGESSALEGETCLYMQPNALRLYEYSIEDHIQEFVKKFGEENAYESKWEYNSSTYEYERIIDKTKINYSYIISALINGEYNNSEVGIAYFENHADLVFNIEFYIFSTRHNSTTKYDNTDPCHPILYTQCDNCDQYMGHAQETTNHDFDDDFTIIATPSGHEGEIFFKRECKVCHKEEVYYATAANLANHISNSVTCYYYIEGVPDAGQSNFDLPHIYVDHVCAFCGEKEIESISVDASYYAEQYEINSTAVNIPQIVVHYYDDTTETVSYLDITTGRTNYNIYLRKDEEQRELSNNYAIYDEEFLGESQLIVEYQGKTATKTITVVPYESPIFGIDYAGLDNDAYAFSGQVFSIRFGVSGSIRDAQFTFTDDGGDPVAVQVLEKTKEVNDWGIILYHVKLQTNYVGTVRFTCNATGGQNSTAECTNMFQVCQFVSFTPNTGKDLEFNYIRNRHEIDGGVGVVRYKNSAEDPENTYNVPLSSLVSWSQLDELEDGAHIITLNVYGQQVDVTINVKGVVGVAPVEGYQTTYEFTDGFDRNIPLVIRYSDGSTDYDFADDVYFTDPSYKPGPGEEPNPPYYYSWDKAGTWRVMYSYMEFSGYYDITVSEKIPVAVESVEIIGMESILIDSIIAQYAFNVTPGDGDVLSVNWSTTTPEIIEVTADEKYEGRVCDVRALNAGIGTLQVEVVTVNGDVITDTFDINVTTTYFPVSDINTYLNNGASITALTCKNPYYQSVETDYLVYSGEFDDLFGELEAAEWNISYFPELATFAAVSSDVKIVILGSYDPEDMTSKEHTLNIYRADTYFGLQYFRTVASFTEEFIGTIGYDYYDQGTSIQAGYRTYTIYVELPADYRVETQEELVALLRSLEPGLQISGAGDISETLEVAIGPIVAECLYNGVAISVQVTDNGADIAPTVVYFYYFTIPEYGAIDW